jgi:hypothetical protein
VSANESTRVAADSCFLELAFPAVADQALLRRHLPGLIDRGFEVTGLRCGILVQIERVVWVRVVASENLRSSRKRRQFSKRS